MWMLVEWSEDQQIYPTYKIIRKKYVLEKDCVQFGKYIRFRDKRSRKKRRAKIVMCSETRKVLKEHKKKLVRRSRKVKAIMAKCMQKCRKQMKRKLMPDPEHELSDCLPGPSKICMLRYPRIPNMPTSPSSSSSSPSATSPSMPSSFTSITIHNTSSCSTTSPSSDEKKNRSEIRMPAPLVERSRSRSPHPGKRRLTRKRMTLLRSRSLICSTPKSRKPPKVVYDNTTQTDPASTMQDPTTQMFVLFAKQIHIHFTKLLGKIEELKASQNENGPSQQNEIDSSISPISDLSNSEDIPHQNLIDILKGLNVNVQVVDANVKRSNEHIRDSNRSVNASKRIVRNPNKNSERIEENYYDLEQNSIELDVNDQNSDNDNIADENEHVADDTDYDYVALDDDGVAANNDHLAYEQNLFADADMEEINRNIDDENMQVFNEALPAVAGNAQNENANGLILYENMPVQPDFAEPRQLPDYPEPIVQPDFADRRELPGYPEPIAQPVYAEPGPLAGYPEPIAQPVFAGPGQLPGYPEPIVQPVFAEPRQLPGYPEPIVEPVFEEPRQPPPYADPGVQPVFAAPIQLPGYPEPRVQPIFEEPRQLPNVQPMQPPGLAGPSRQPAPVEPRPSSPKPRKLEVRRVSAQSTIPGEPSAAAQRNVYRDEEMVAIGFHRTLVPRRLMNDINWTSYTTATRQLMRAIFPRKILATHSLSGKPSPAFAHHPPKKRLDSKLIDDIVEVVRTRCRAERPWIRAVITNKCTDEARMYRNRRNQNNRNDEDQENQEPEEGPASRERRRRRGQEESSSDSD